MSGKGVLKSAKKHEQKSAKKDPVAGNIQGVFFTGTPLKYGKPRLGESTLTYIGLDTPNLV